MRIGIFGGTFDPIHHGHLILAEQAREQGQLDAVWFVPAPRPPQKDAETVTPFERRVEMIQLAIAGNVAFAVDPLERERPGPSYTVDTLAELGRRHPGDEFWLLIGSDSLADLPMWREPAAIVARAGLLVMARSGATVLSTDDLRTRLGISTSEFVGLEVVRAPTIDISSRELRGKVAAGHSIRYFLPRSVEVYIQEKGLYR
jgi:nicotinate-nucleotide adenylyltransferase